MEVKVENWELKASKEECSAWVVGFKKVLTDCTQPVHSEFCSSREAHGNQYDVPSLLMDTALMDIKEK